jgi:hypothetical protein
LPRWRARASRSEDGPTGGSVAVVSGSIRSPDEADALSVELSISDTEITMRADGTELGSWHTTAVDIRRIDATGFAFAAEGDRLIFIPDDPVAFGDSPIVGGRGSDTGNRKGRTSKKDSDDAEPRLAWDEDSTGEERHPRRRAASESPNEKPSRRSRYRRKTTEKIADVEAIGPEMAPVPPSAVPEPIDRALDGEESVSDAASPTGRGQHQSRHTRPVPSQGFDDALPGEPRERRRSAWLGALDIARRYDAFGLDRVPVDEGLRGHEHQHTWDHRVASSSGLGAHVCTICGAIRR